MSSLRTDNGLAHQIPCGPREQPQVGYRTWRAIDGTPEGIPGDLGAVEFLPDGFVPIECRETPP